MDLLILGGTRFLGYHLTESALGRGHRVTHFNRGRSDPEAFPGVERLVGDRYGDLSALQGRTWDVAIDTCGYLPRTVRASASLLAGAVAHYTFVSSISVYEDFGRTGFDEGARLRTPPDPEPEELDLELYGELTVGCERAAEAAMPGRVLVVRPGLIVGPRDSSDRFTYWCRRVAEGGEVLAPGDPGRRVQLIDARDLAGWMLWMVENRRTGFYNATGPAEGLTMGGMLEGIRDAAASEARLVWASEEFPIGAGVEPWQDLPIWLPEEMAGMLDVDVGRAVGDGLAFRPLAETVRDTLAWDGDRGEPELEAGMTRERERRLLRDWHKATIV